MKGLDKIGAPMYIISKQRLKLVFARLRNRLSSLDSSTSAIEVTGEYAHTLLRHVHQKAWWKTHDWWVVVTARRSLFWTVLNLPFLMMDLLRPGVWYYFIDIILCIWFCIVHNILPETNIGYDIGVYLYRVRYLYEIGYDFLYRYHAVDFEYDVLFCRLIFSTTKFGVQR